MFLLIMHFFPFCVKKERRKKKFLTFIDCLFQVLTENKEYSCTTFPCTLSGLPENIRALKLLFLVIILKAFSPIFIFSCLMIWQVSSFFVQLLIDAFGNPRRPLLRHLSPDILCVLAQHHGRLNYAFWVRRKDSKSFAHST